MARTKGKSRGKRKTHKARKSKVRAFYQGGYTPMATPTTGGTFKDVFKTSLGTSLGTIGAVKAIDTVTGLFQKKKTKSRPKRKAPILKSYDPSSGRYTYG